MSNNQPFDPALRALLDAAAPPALSAGFADRVLAAANARPAALPPLRRPAAPRWRTSRKLVVGLVFGGLLSSAAAATGVFEQIGITLPQPLREFVDDVTEAVTGRESAPSAGNGGPSPLPTIDPVIEGPIDHPEELEEAFRRIDSTRDRRTAQRRERVDERIDTVLERRRSEGLPVPDADQEALLRQRLEAGRARRDALAGERREAIREELRESVAEGDPITREDFVGEGTDWTPERREQLRQRLLQRRQELLQQAVDPEAEAEAAVPPEAIPENILP